MRKKQITTLLLALTLVMTGCVEPAGPTTTAASAETTTTTAAEEPSKEEMPDAVTLTISSDINGTDAAKYAVWGEDPISRHIMNLTGVRLVVERDAVNLNSRIASNDFSDLMFVTDTESTLTLSNEMYNCDIIELAKEYCPEFLDELDPMEQLGNMASDGHVYTLVRGATNRKALEDPNTALTAPRYLLLDQTMLTQLEREIPASVEELESLLYAAHAALPENVMITPDVLMLPIAEWMGIERDVYWDDEAKSVRLPVGKETWKEYLLMLNRWYRDGVLTLGSEPGTLGFAHAVSGSHINMCEGSLAIEPGTQDLVLHHVLVEEPLTWQGEMVYNPQLVDLGIDPGQYREQKGGLFISRNCSNKERAIQFVRFLKSREAGMLTRWGIEDEYYTLSEEGVTYTEEFQNAEYVNFFLNWPTKFNREYGFASWNYLTDGWVEGMTLSSPMQMTNPNLKAMREMTARAGKVYKEYVADDWNPALSQTIPTPNSPENYAWYQRVESLWAEGVNSVVTAPTADEAEAAWDSLINSLNQENLTKLEALMTEKYTQLVPLYQAEGLLKEVVLE